MEVTEQAYGRYRIRAAVTAARGRAVASFLHQRQDSPKRPLVETSADTVAAAIELLRDRLDEREAHLESERTKAVGVRFAIPGRGDFRDVLDRAPLTETDFKLLRLLVFAGTKGVTATEIGKKMNWAKGGANAHLGMLGRRVGEFVGLENLPAPGTSGVDDFCFNVVALGTGAPSDEGHFVFAAHPALIEAWS